MHFPNGSLLSHDSTIAWSGGDAVNGSHVFRYQFHAYDFRSVVMQQKWAARITGAVATGHVDGAFIDGNRGGWGFGNQAACKGNSTCAKALAAGLAAAHHMAAAAVGPSRTLISNYPTPEALGVCNGGMCERCGHDIKTVMMLHKNYAKRRCGLWNQSCVLQYRPFGTGQSTQSAASQGAVHRRMPNGYCVAPNLLF